MSPQDDDKTTPFIRDEPGKPASQQPVPTSLQPLNLQHRAGVVGASFMRAKTGQRVAAAAVIIIGVLVLAHIGAIGASWANSVWAIERLPPPDMSAISNLALAPTPPPPPPPPPGGAKPKTEVVKPKKPTVKELVQPVKIEKQEKATPDPVGSEHGVEGGEEGGVEGGVVGGVQGAPPPPPPPPPPPAPPQNVPPTMLEGQRIAGEKMIRPNDVTKTEIQRSGKSRVVGSFKICLTVDGAPSSVITLGKGTGFPSYDAKILSEMRQWRYRPYMVNGKAVPVCTAVTFIYTQN